MSLMSPSLFFQQYSACLGWFMRWEISGRTAAVLLGIASRICSKQYTAFLCSSHLAFSPCILLESRWCIHFFFTLLWIPSNLNITWISMSQHANQSPNTLFYIKSYIYILKTTFASFEIKFLTIHLYLIK